MKAVTKKAMSLLLSVTLAVCSFAGASASGAESNVEDSCYDSNFDSGAYRYHVTDSGKDSGKGIWDSGYVTLKTVDSGKAGDGSSYSVPSEVTHKDEAGKHNTHNNTHNYEVNAIDKNAFTFETKAKSIKFGKYSVKAGEGGYIGIYKDSGANDVYAVAFADKAYSFNGWDTGNKSLQNKIRPLDLTGNEGKTVTAQFSKIEQPVKPVPVTSASISGTPQVGETLTAAANDGATNVTYQWKVSDTSVGDYTDIDKATEKTYVLTEAEKGKFIKVVISGDNGSSETSDATAAVADAETTVNVTTATITGTAKVGETLTAAANDGATNVTYQWKVSNTADGSYTDIDGATNSTFKLTADQKGKYIEVKISGDNDSSKTSKPTGPVEAAPEKSTDATLQSTIGKVNNDAGTITDIPAGTTLADFKAAITPATGAAFEVYEADGTTAATDLKSGYKVIVTAEDGSTKTYTLTVKAAPANYTLSIGTESKGGIGFTRAITVGGTKAKALTGKYLVAEITEGSGSTAKVSVVMLALSAETNISYQTANASVEAWIVSSSSMPIFTNKGISGNFDAHDVTV